MGSANEVQDSRGEFPDDTPLDQFHHDQQHDDELEEEEQEEQNQFEDRPITYQSVDE